MSQQCARFGIVDDDALECDHTFSVQTGDPSVGSRNIFQSSTTVAITDNDGMYVNSSSCFHF